MEIIHYYQNQQQKIAATEQISAAPSKAAVTRRLTAATGAAGDTANVTPNAHDVPKAIPVHT